MGLTDHKGFDDVMVFAPVRPVVEMGDRLLGKDGASISLPARQIPEFKAEFNFYNVHYASTHVVGTSGGNTADMIESIDMMNKGLLNTAS